VQRLRIQGARRVLIGLGIGALAFGPGVGIASSRSPGVAVASAARWAYPQSAALVRSAPSANAASVGRLHFLTEDGQAEVYEALRQEARPGSGAVWVEVAVPERPNGVTGWVPVRALGPLHAVRDRLVIDRSRLRATLYGATGRVIWSAPAGVGRASLPTPAGHFYVREKLRAIGSPIYGPYAIGTSAYAPTLSEWPGGGVVGIHGTDQPGLIPGRPSHGCVRLRNADITRLWHLITVGTPVDVT
jgi:lipoprotein-anchoring transpeptidase ErfK/SrfK